MDPFLIILILLIILGVIAVGFNKSPLYEMLDKRKYNNVLTNHHHHNNSYKMRTIKDNYETISEVQQALKRAGLESSSLIVGIDYTKSNLHNGSRTFNGLSLHNLSNEIQNPYQRVIDLIGKTLEPFDDDNIIPTFGFGDITTGNKSVFPFYQNRSPHGFRDVLSRYLEITEGIMLSGPTNFAPIINKAIEIVKELRTYHILIIICDGQVINVKQTVNSIVEASKVALSIVCIGVGDGPWEMMEEFDDGLPQRQFDNFQFVDFNKCINTGRNPEATFALNALMELPEQYKAIRDLNLL